ncbi:MAG: hypothetical protein IPM61_15220 [Chlorobi bacterium]|nr:MAG: hypothetical protein UZ07_CHB004003115 [Chlorobi bacterium OLB7]MBK8912661.1 hypothetical protein [Chlorobiota bacterium]MBX7216405.1 hypothetical protein [Candidatus Kapabacteria bacterium]MCE7934244.1 hypothetical protein [Chlorobi bacterium CHB2]
MKTLLLALAALLLTSTATLAQTTEPTVIAIFPFKNLSGEVIYDDLSWPFSDSLHHYLSTKPESGTKFTLVSMDDVRDQMLANNVDVKSPSYETDVWAVAQALGARKVVWGTYFVKYETANLEAKVVDCKTLMHDQVNMAKKIRPKYPEALTQVTTVGDKILPAMN